ELALAQAVPVGLGLGGDRRQRTLEFHGSPLARRGGGSVGRVDGAVREIKRAASTWPGEPASVRLAFYVGTRAPIASGLTRVRVRDGRGCTGRRPGRGPRARRSCWCSRWPGARGGGSTRRRPAGRRGGSTGAPAPRLRRRPGAGGRSRPRRRRSSPRT